MMINFIYLFYSKSAFKYRSLDPLKQLQMAKYYVTPSLSMIGCSARETGSQQRTACNNPQRTPHSGWCNWTELPWLATSVASATSVTSSRFARTCDDLRQLTLFVARRRNTTSQRATRPNWTGLNWTVAVQFSRVARCGEAFTSNFHCAFRLVGLIYVCVK